MVQDMWIETNDKRRMYIPQGTHIRLDVWNANRCEDFWGESVSGYPADIFEPMRWNILSDKGNKAKKMPTCFLVNGLGFVRAGRLDCLRWPLPLQQPSKFLSLLH